MNTQRIAVLAFILALLTLPAVVPEAQSQQLLNQEPPNNCISASPPHSEQTTEQPVNAVFTRNSSNSSTFTIQYNTTKAGYGFRVEPVDGTKVISSSGFEHTPIGLRWDRETNQSHIRFQLSESIKGFQFKGGDEWIIGPIPEHSGNADISFQTQEGYLGSKLFLLGEYTEYSRHTGCQEISLIAPSETNFGANPDRILDTYTQAAEMMDTGGAYQHVRGFVTPKSTGKRSGFAPSSSNGIANEFVVSTEADLRSVKNTWLHEYIHTHQHFQPRAGLQWIYEGSATYLTARISLEQGLISPTEYDRALQRYANYEAGNTTLNEVTRENLAYRRGSVVLSRIDALHSSNRSSTVIQLIHWMNTQNGDRPARITYENFEQHYQTTTNHSGTFSPHNATFTATDIQPGYETAHTFPLWQLRRLAAASNSPTWMPALLMMIATTLAFRELYPWAVEDLYNDTESTEEPD